MKKEGSASGSESGFISQRHGSPDPDPHQNVMHPQHCSFFHFFGSLGPHLYGADVDPKHVFKNFVPVGS